jgi:hypothetical protein
VAAFVFFDEFKKRLGDGDIDLTTSTGHTFKLFLTNTAPNVDTHDDKTDLTELSATGGYTTKTLTHSWAETSAGTGIWRFANNADVVWTASGGTFDTFRYVALYDDTHASDALVGYWDNGSTVSLTDTNTFTLNLDANFEIFTLDG